MVEFIEGVGIVLDTEDQEIQEECSKEKQITKNIHEAIKNYFIGYEVK